MRVKIRITVALLSFALTACKKQDSSEFTDTPVIESYLQPGNVMNVKLSRQIPFSSGVNYSADDINALSVNVTCNNVTYPLTAYGNGQYADSNLIVAEGAKYNLSFTYNKKPVTAYTYIPAKPQGYTQSVTQIAITRMDSTSTPMAGGFTMPDPVTLSWTNTDGSYYIVVIENIEATLDPIRDFGNNAPPGNRFKKKPTNSTSIEIRANEFQYYGTHRLILYHVLPDYATLYDDNSTSSQNLTNPSTSISNGYGIFTGLNSDTLMLEVKEP
ncbi:MAG: hypothetical protein JWP12_1787 [Bacteroidetes bacterium]|nr:hypothetical protein [Bacteroidota bacterium]